MTKKTKAGIKRIIIILIVSIILIVGLTPKGGASDFSDKYELYDAWSQELKDFSLDVCKEFNVPYAAVVAIIYHESRFDPSVGETYIGLMQVGATTDVLNFLKNNGLETSKKELYSPKTNIMAGTLILKYALEKAEYNIEEAFYIYTCGEGAVKRRNVLGLSKNKATIEITDLYYAYANYLAEQERQQYNSFLLNELETAQTELANVEELLNNCAPYEEEYYSWYLKLAQIKVEFIESELNENG